MAPGLRRAVPSSSMPALGPQLADGEQLDDALLHLVEAGVVGVEGGAGHVDVELVVGALGPRQVEHGVEPALDPAVLHVLLGHALEAAELLAQGPHDVVGDAGGLEGVDARAVVVGRLAVVVSSPSSLRMASICRRSRYSRCCWSSPSGTSWRIFSASSSSARASLAQPSTSRTRSVTSIVSSSSTLRSVERSGHQPTRSARPPGSSASTLRRMPRTWRSPRCSNRAAQGGAQLGAEGLGLVGRRAPRRRGSAVTHRPAPVPTTPAPMRARPVARTTRACGAAGQRAGRLDPGDGADAGEAVADLGARGGARRRRRRRPRRRPWPRRTRRRWSPPCRAGPRRREGAGRAGCWSRATGHGASRVVTCGLQVTT